ncbi:MAG: hypothetical protein WBL05_09175 [Brooklawnia sp.]|uniref:hypothetical protein n=1 Tax=Brooklawnia sp. TaxID=2699740 RepID=UPI003C754ADD
MDDEIQLISDGDGLAVIGDPAAVERFLSSEGLPSKNLDLHRLRSAAGQAGEGIRAGSEIVANSGRWVKMTKESAHLVEKYGLMKSSDSGLSLGVVYARGQAKGIKGIVQFENVPRTLVANLANPAVLAGAAGLMAQVAMQQTIAEIVDYLARIDEKVDDVLRTQKDSVLADMIGVGLVVDEAMIIRQQVGRVSDVAWSKVQATSATIARTQAYALRQLDALVEKMDRKSQVGDLAKAAREAEAKAQEWLVVLARCFQLLDAVAVLELDRVLEAAPEELDRHRRALRITRQNRLELISRSTLQLVARLEVAAETANTRVLLHPIVAREIVASSNNVAANVVDFHGRLGIERHQQSWDVKTWLDAVGEVRDQVRDSASGGLESAKRFGEETYSRASDVFRRVDLDGDGIPDKPRALVAIDDAGSTVKGTALGAVEAVGSLFRRKRGIGGSAEQSEPESPPLES